MREVALQERELALLTEIQASDVAAPNAAKTRAIFIVAFSFVAVPYAADVFCITPTSAATS